MKMKKLRFLVPLFSFGLILAYALAVQYGGEEGFISVSQVYSPTSKSFSGVSTKLRIGEISFTIFPPGPLLLAFIVSGGFLIYAVVIYAIIYAIFYMALFIRKLKGLLKPEEVKSEDT